MSLNIGKRGRLAPELVISGEKPITDSIAFRSNCLVWLDNRMMVVT